MQKNIYSLDMIYNWKFCLAFLNLVNKLW